MTELLAAKRFTDEVYRRALKESKRTVINHVNYNGYDYALLFVSYNAGDEFEEYGLKGEHYFVTLVATYGNNFDRYSLNTKHQEVYEVSKDEGNEIYKRVKATRKFQKTA